MKLANIAAFSRLGRSMQIILLTEQVLVSTLLKRHMQTYEEASVFDIITLTLCSL